MLEDFWPDVKRGYEQWAAQYLSPHTRSSQEWLEVVCENFAVLFGVVKDMTPQSVRPTEMELAIALSLLILGPEDVMPPPCGIRRGLCQQLLATDRPVDIVSCFEGTIAWGCGWRRDIAIGSNDPWTVRWDKAVVLLRNLVERSVHHAGHLLARRLTPGSQNSLFDQQEARSYANLIALECIHDRCSCGHHQRDCRSRAGQQTCNRPCCRREHRLSTWEPHQCSLQAFLAQAVRGSATTDLQVGSFANSILYTLLAEDIGLLVGSAEFKRCHKCGELYEGGSCSHCRTSYDPQQTYCLARKNWLLIPYEENGNYQLQIRWRCRRCNHLFGSDRLCCPLCSGEHSQRQTKVWCYVRSKSE